MAKQCGLRILLYHAVGTRLRHDPYGISISTELFERHMALLAGIKDIRPVGLLDWRPASQGLHVAVTFDDGYKDNLNRAAPILQRYGIPFTVFATSAYLQSGSDEYLTPAELRDLAELPGVSIGSHGTTHRPLSLCDDAALQSELNGSRCYLEDLLGRPVVMIAYPHGSTDVRVAQAARRAGYTLGVCSRFGLNDGSRHPLHLRRTEVVAFDSERVFRQKLNGAWDWYRWKTREPFHPGSDG